METITQEWSEGIGIGRELVRDDARLPKECGFFIFKILVSERLRNVSQNHKEDYREIPVAWNEKVPNGVCSFS